MQILGIGSKIEIADKVFVISKISKDFVTVTNDKLSRQLSLSYVEKHIKE